MTRTSEWLALPPASDLSLQAERQRGADLRDLSAAVQAGARVENSGRSSRRHAIWRESCIGCCAPTMTRFALERPMADDELIQFFRDDLAAGRHSGPLPARTLRGARSSAVEGFPGRVPARSRAQCASHRRVFRREGGRRDSGRPHRPHRPGCRRAAWSSPTTRPARPNRRKIPTRACSFPSMPWRRARSGDTTPITSCSTTWKETARSSPGAAIFNWKQAKSRVMEVAENIAAGKFEPKPGFYCRFCAYRNLCPATEKRLQEPTQEKAATQKDTCHPERSSCFAKRSSCAVEGPLSPMRSGRSCFAPAAESQEIEGLSRG